VLEARDFTDPRWTAADRMTLQYLTDVLAKRAGDPARKNGWTRWADAHAVHRWLLPSWERLAAASEADGVGFFGQLRSGGEVAFPSGLEPQVAEAAAAEGWLLAYLNVRFVDAAEADGPLYANLVVVTNRAAARALEGDAAHTEAVTRAAATYESIRIHRLVLAGPPTSRPRTRILETLYIDFGSSPPWRAVRAVDP